MKPLQKRAKNGMFGHPAWNAFALLSSICWLLNDESYRCVITRNGPVLQLLEDMGVAMKISRLSRSQVTKGAIYP